MDSTSSSTADAAYIVVGRRQLVIALQFINASLVTFGGSAFTLLGVNLFGNATGAGHLTVGLAGLYAGIITARRTVLPRNLLIGVNSVTVVYSLISTALAGILSLLPSAAYHDSLIGTAIAIAISATLILLLTRKP